jgi:hypothetical protein
VKTDILSSVLEDVRKTLGPLTISLRRSAAASGWPKELVNQLSVNLVKDRVIIDYPEDIKSDIDSWEYGTERRRPTAVLRKFAERLDSKSRSILNKGAF